MAPNLKELGLCDTVKTLFRDEILRAFFMAHDVFHDRDFMRQTAW